MVSPTKLNFDVNMLRRIIVKIIVPAIPLPDAEPAPPRTLLVPERSDFLEGDAPAADKVGAFLAQA
jgi:hypothetical protein